jgi:hypothetical protein
MTHAEISQKLFHQESEPDHYSMSAATRVPRRAAKALLAKVSKPRAALVVAWTIEAVTVLDARVAFVNLAVAGLANEISECYGESYLL